MDVYREGSLKPLLSEKQTLDLVEHVYAAGCDPSQWRTFVTRVQSLLPFSAFSLHVSIEGTSIAENCAAAGIPPEQIDSYIAHYQFQNPYNDLFRKIPVGSVHTVHGLVPENWIKRYDFYHEWLKPAGNLTHAAGMVLVRDPRRLLRLSLDIPERQGGLEQPAAAFLTFLQPHLMRAFDVNERLDAALTAEQALSTMLGRMAGAAFVLSRYGRVAGMNAAAEDLARAGTLFKVEHGQVLFRQPDADSRFRSAVQSVLDVAQPASPVAFRVGDGSSPLRLVTVLPLRTPGTAVNSGAQAMALVVLRAADETHGVPRSLLQSLYRLTKSEAEVADLIAMGLSVAEAAEALEVTQVTVRNQVAAAMTKMGVHRQAELVAEVLRLAPRLSLDDER